ncbi:MAG: PKD domain-containing protein [Flavobacteriales bacterium]|nr:PKD domain-containing protein [Flavobacteriales bacterium]
MKRTFLILFSFALILNGAFSQRGKDGAKVVSATEIVNAFTSLTVDASAGSTAITVTNSALSANFSGNLSRGDLIMIYQIQGASVEDTMAGSYPNSSKFFNTWGRITNYNNCGNYEFVQVDSVPNATTINLDCALQNNYTASGRVLVIRVPRYTTLTVNNGGVLTTSQWNGTSGGVLAVEVLGQTTINAGGIVDVSGLGFRGGLAVTSNQSSVYGGLRYADANVLEGAQKGEGIAGDQAFYTTMNDGGAAQCRGAAANAGGGGNSHNAGGGGGGNAGDINSWNNGIGNPDVSAANYITAWTLDPSYAPTPTTVSSSGGGRGGYSILKNDQNELTMGPNNVAWGGDQRRDNGGLGGRPLDYSTGKIFLGGGGGAGEGDNADPSDGGNGGGLIFMYTYGDISGGGNIVANGANGVDINPGSAGFGQLAGVDGAGGAGAGGTVILKTTGTVNLSGAINADGGNGGNQVLVAGLFASIDEAEGPGGGGGGGYIAVSSGAPTRTATGGANGVTNGPYVSNFPPNGATMGGDGTNNATINSFDFTVAGDSICANTTATLTASFTGTPPGGAQFEWYDAEFGGTLLFTGASFTTPVLAANTTYWVKACPAPYLVPVNVIVTVCAAGPVAGFSATDSTICAGDCIDFTDLSTGSPTIWSWHFFGAATTSSSSQNPANICYNNPGTFDVALFVSDGTNTDSLFMPNFITVSALPTVTASADTAICLGDTANISVSGTATTYSWDNGLGNGTSFAVTPAVNTTYHVTGTNANSCSAMDSVIVTINALPTVTASADTSICLGDAANISVSGTATTYSWDNGLGNGTNFAVTPAVNTTYHVTGTDANSCSAMDSVIVTINALPTVTASADTSICLGDAANISVSGTATTYSWDNGLGNGTNFTVTPAVNTTYHVTGTDANSCSAMDSVMVTVNPLPTVTASNDTTICSGDAANLSVSGTATTYSWDNGLGNGTNFTVNPLITTTYHVTGSDANSCSAMDSVMVTVNPLPTVTASADTSICMGDAANISVSGTATTYSWDNGLGNGTNFAVTPAVNTTYHVTGTDGNNCSATDSVMVTINPLPIVTASNDTTICSGDAANISVSGNATTYSWDNGLGNGTNFAVSPVVNTTYHVTGTDGNSCSATDSVTVTVTVCGVPPVTSFSASDSTICVGDCIDFTDLSSSIPTGWTWYFFGAATTTSALQNPTNICYNNAGSFDVALVSSNASGQDSLFIANFITVSPPPTVTASNDTTICSGDNANISVSGTATTYSWDNGLGNGTSFTVTPVVNTTYHVTGTDANGCIANDSVMVTINPIPTVTASNDTTICAGDPANISVSGTATTYSWDNGLGNGTSFSVTPGTTTTYHVTGSDASSCSASDSVVVTVNPAPTVTASNDTSICLGDTANISVSGTATTYSWDNGLGNGTNFAVTPAVNTTYHVTGTDGSGCSNTDSVMVTVTNCNIPPVAAFNASGTSLCINDCIDFTDLSTGGVPTNWSWYFEGGTPDTSTQQNPSNICYNTVGTFDVYLVVSNAFGQDSLYMNNYVTVDSCNTVEEILVIPNVFSPNGDGENDLFKPFGNNITSLHMEIYNRWGEVLYMTDFINAGWDGRTTAGDICSDGTYFYLITVNGELYKGSITLIR